MSVNLQRHFKQENQTSVYSSTHPLTVYNNHGIQKTPKQNHRQRQETGSRNVSITTLLNVTRIYGDLTTLTIFIAH
jgi:hypothetical protein